MRAFIGVFNEGGGKKNSLSPALRAMKVLFEIA